MEGRPDDVEASRQKGGPQGGRCVTRSEQKHRGAALCAAALAFWHAWREERVLGPASSWDCVPLIEPPYL